jgi:uncharacterized protein (DUF849 family)
MDGAVKTIKACLNGKRGRAEHPAVPVTPGELAGEAAAAVAAGAEAVHLHARGADGAESLRAADVGAAVAAVRQACPATAVGVSTGVWITGGDAAGRAMAVAGWTALTGPARPDFASVNVGEEGWAGVVRLLAGAGIGVEAGVWSVADVHALAAAAAPGPLLRDSNGHPQPLLRIMVEVIGQPAERAVAVADGILDSLDASPLSGVPRLVHGEEGGCWPLVAHAGQLGVPTRIGLEDCTAGPDGEPVSGNAELVRLALAVLATVRPEDG